MVAVARRFQSASAYRKYTIACVGDSLTLATGNSLRASDYYPEVLANLLRAQGALIKARNFGISGNTTLQMWDRSGAVGSACFTQFLTPAGAVEIPNLLILWGGTNDPGAGISATGGTTGSPSSTQTYLQAMIDFALTAGVKRIIVLSQHFLNYTSGGDTTSMTTANCSYATLIAAQQAAVTTFAGDVRGTVLFCDQWTYTKTLLLAANGAVPAVNSVVGNRLSVLAPQYKIAPVVLSASQYPQVIGPTVYQINANAAATPTEPRGGAGIHLAATANVHHNELGSVIVANALYGTIAAQSGWISGWAT